MPKKGRIARSVKGVMVDFDLIDIKAQMESAPKPTEVKAREEYIEKRLRRRAKRIAERQHALETEKELVKNVEPSEEEEPILVIEKPIVEKKPIPEITEEEPSKTRRIIKKIEEE